MEIIGLNVKKGRFMGIMISGVMDGLRKAIELLYQILFRLQGRPRFDITISAPWNINNDSNQKDSGMITKELKRGTGLTLTFTPVDDNGNPAKVDGQAWIEFESGSESIGTFAKDLTGLVIDVLAPKSLSGQSARFKLKADADLGSGVVTIEETVEIKILDPQAKNFKVESSEPFVLPDAPPPPPPV